MNISAIRKLSAEYAKGDFVKPGEEWRPLARKHAHGRARRKKTRELSPRVVNMQRYGEEAKERKWALKSKPTAAECAFAEILKSLKIPAAFQRIVYLERRYFILDFVVRMKPKVIFELDGQIHQDRQAYDEERTRLVLGAKPYVGFQVVRIRNEDVFSGKARKVVEALYPRQVQRWGGPQ